jgi:nicotinamidase-related amidase
MKLTFFARHFALCLAASCALVATSAFAQSSASSASAGKAGASQPASPQNAVWNHDQVALLLIDYQPEMFSSIRSETNADLIELNTRFLIRVAKAVNIPVILSTVGVEMGVNGPTKAPIAEELQGVKVVDRSSMNAWEDRPFLNAVKATGKKRLVFGALYTEICLTYPVLEAMKEGYEVSFVADAVGGTSQTAHATAIERMIQAGAVPNTALALAAELFRDWKSAEAAKIRPVVVWYLGELKKRGLQ